MTGAVRVALVTGAARGIGAAIARRMVTEGLVTIRSDRLAPNRWEDVDGAATGPQLDVTDQVACRAAVERIIVDHGRLDVLVNNAGIVARGPAEDVEWDTWQRVLDVNLTGTFLLCQAAQPALAVSGAGAIVNVASTSGRIAVPNTVAYCVSKAAVIHLSGVLALEWARYGIRVNAVGPTIVPTAMTEDVRADAAYMDDKLASIPLGRMAAPDDVADAVAYLASPQAGMITGQTLFVDGGATIR